MKARKTFGRILSVLTAVVISACTMVCSASAVSSSWSLYRRRSATKPGAPYETQTSMSTTYLTISRITYFTITCPHWSSDADSNGNVSYAYVRADIVSHNGRNYNLNVSGNYYFKKKTDSEIKRTLTTAAVYGDKLKISYLTYDNHLFFNFSGTTYVPNGIIASNT